MVCAESTFTGNIYNIQIPVKVIPDIISHDTDLTYAGRGRRPMGMPVYIQMTGKLYDCADHGRANEHIACKPRCHCFSGQRGKARKSVVSETSVSVRVDLGGRRIIKKKNTTYAKQ